MHRSPVVVFALALFAVVPLFSGCTSNAEKIGQFCSDWKGAIESNEGDCDAMGAALKEVVVEYEDIKLYGRTDDEASQKATEDCQAAVDALLTCIDNPAVTEAMELLETQK